MNCIVKIMTTCILLHAISHNMVIGSETPPEQLLNADLIIFSYNRPMQLYALLESIEANLNGIASTTVIYRTDNDRYEQAYQLVANHFMSTIFIKQSDNPEQDFKPLTIEAIKTGISPYILFAVDDIIVKNKADIATCIRTLEETQAYSFYLRLGTHLTTCYALSRSQPVPQLNIVDSSIVAWILATGSGDWGYPNTVDMSLYRKQDVLQDLEAINFNNPNRLEASWAGQGRKVALREGLCFIDSVVVNIPMNLVQTVWNNRHMDSWSPEQLLEIFEQGSKIDISPLQGIQNPSCHIDYNVTFIAREALATFS